jgi:hypothetical protein
MRNPADRQRKSKIIHDDGDDFEGEKVLTPS